MSFYRLTHVDGRPLPIGLPIAGAEYVITGGSIRFEPGTKFAAALGVDGLLDWDLQGYRPPEVQPTAVTMARHYYRRIDTHRVQFPFDQPDVPAEYTADVADGALTLRSQTEVEREFSPARMFGGDHEWRFAAAPGEDLGSRPVCAARALVGVRVSIGGREVPWLGRLLKRFAGPTFRWLDRRRLRQLSRHRDRPT
ncbi:MAG TPA: hypothetical protein VFK04_11465 [Gemmatimonadaceae bacterium]|nr:hypothetical protein [Gemmatimonadaceae bacterium]